MGDGEALIPEEQVPAADWNQILGLMHHDVVYIPFFLAGLIAG